MRERPYSPCWIPDRLHTTLATAPDRNGLLPDPLFDDISGSPVHHVVIWFHLSCHQRFPQSKDGVDDGLAQQPRDRVGGEQHTGDLALDHLLNDYCQGESRLAHTVPEAIADGARGPETAPTSHHRCQQVLPTDYIQNRVLLPGERERGGILQRCRGANGHRRQAELCVGLSNIRFHGTGYPSASERRTNRGGGLLQAADVAPYKPLRGTCDRCPQGIGLNEGTVDLNREDEASRHWQAGAGEPGQIRRFAADPLPLRLCGPNAADPHGNIKLPPGGMGAGRTRSCSQAIAVRPFEKGMQPTQLAYSCRLASTSSMIRNADGIPPSPRIFSAICCDRTLY